VATRAPVVALLAGSPDFQGVYDELRIRAASLMRRQRRTHTLQPTALVHEALLRVKRTADTWDDPAALLRLASTAMRTHLVDHARRKRRRKRAASGVRIPADEILGECEASGLDLLDLDEALTDLAVRDPSGAEIVELRFFGGLSTSEIASLLGLHRRTVEERWRSARERLRRRLR